MLSGLKYANAQYVLDDEFGFDLQISGLMGPQAIIGAPNRSGLKDKGRVYFFNYDYTTNLWTRAQVVTPCRSGVVNFGNSVSIHNNTRALVGESRANLGQGGAQEWAGAVYFLNRGSSPSSWAIAQRIPNPYPLSLSDPDYFGHDVSIFGDYALVSAPNEDTAGEDVGLVYIYKITNGIWNLAGTIQPPSVINENMHFGHQVALSDGNLGYPILAAISAVDERGTTSHPYHGAVYVYGISASGQATMIGDKIAPETYMHPNGAKFGYSLDIFGSPEATVAIGAPDNRGNGSVNGSVFIYRNSGLGWEQRFVKHGVTYAERLGVSVVLKGTTPLIMMAATTGRTGSGRVDRFALIDNIWTQIEPSFYPDDSIDYCLHGASVDFTTGGSILTGAPGCEGLNEVTFGSVLNHRYNANIQELRAGATIVNAPLCVADS